MIRGWRRAGRAAFRFLFRTSGARAAVSGFALTIVVGAIVLALPFSSRAHVWTSPVDTIFTSTSAVCVTGLIVKSTPDYWSMFGQIVILLLIQTGGLGIMTLGAFVAVLMQQRLSFRLESFLGGMVESPAAASIWTLIRFIITFTLIAEVLGAVGLCLAWHGEFTNFWTCFYHSIFHSISAFCNAGFSLNNDSLVRYAGSVPINFIVCGLVIVGGLGFLVVKELADYGWWLIFRRRGKRPRLSTHSRLVLRMTGILLVIGFCLFFLIVQDTPLLAHAGLKRKLLVSMFQAVTPRTAGFNTIPMGPGMLVPAAAFLVMALMYIGGSPGSTAGGIKTSTLGIMIGSIAATLKGRSRVEMFHHSVPQETVHRVTSIVLLSVGALTAAVFCLLISETWASFQQIIFDSISAFGTVGLSQGLIGPGTQITAFGRMVLTGLMFIGRLGPVTLLFSVAQLKEKGAYQYPEEQILVG